VIFNVTDDVTLSRYSFGAFTMCQMLLQHIHAMHKGLEMISKQHLKSRPVCKVTFTLPDTIEARSVSVVGSFNDWDPDANPLRKQKNRVWRTTVELQPGEVYEFRYLMNGETWFSDDDSDGSVTNEFGSQNSIVETTQASEEK
jgi:1,4-alpha-glucan branching enzyme